MFWERRDKVTETGTVTVRLIRVIVAIEIRKGVKDYCGDLGRISF